MCMSLIKWEPFNDFDRLFQEFGGLTQSPSNRAGLDLAADVYEEGNAVVVEMNLPGLKGEDIDVEVEDDYVRIAGRREEVQEKKEKSHYAKEIRRGSFERVIPVPSPVETKGVEAAYKDGVLKITMPKKERSEDSKVKVTVE